MALSKIFSVLVPKNNDFFTLFEQSSANLQEMARVFQEMVNEEGEKRFDMYKQIEQLEHKGDEITHKIFLELSTNFITPFDREDISYLASSLDDIMDHICGSAKRLKTYRVEGVSQPAQRLSEIIVQSAKEIHVAILGMKEMKNPIRTREALIRINSLENQADEIFDTALANLFEIEKDAIKLMMIKEVLSYMETATDKCEDVANVIEMITVKNS